MTKKRKRASLAPYIHHLDQQSDTTYNLSAYHPDLDLSTVSPEYHSLLPHCLVHPSSFPPPLLKYWRHRSSLFSLYSAGCLLDEQSWYSVTPEPVAFRIAKRCATEGAVVDLFAGAGGNAIQFAMTCAKVIAVEVDEVKLKLAKWNAKVYGVDDRITFVHGDSIEFLDTLDRWRDGGAKQQDVWKGITSSDVDQIQAVFLSPPWGGVDYASSKTYSLSSTSPLDGTLLFARARKAFATNNIAYYLPRNTNLHQLHALTQHLHPPHAHVKVEYQYVNHGAKLSSLTAYYGGLATDWNDEDDDWKQP